MNVGGISSRPWRQVPPRQSPQIGAKVHQSSEPVQLELDSVAPLHVNPQTGQDLPLSELSRHAYAVQLNQAHENHQREYPGLVRRAQALGFDEAQLKNALAYLDQQAPLTINLPPVVNKESVLASLSSDGAYKNLWERGSRPSHPKAPKRSKADFLHKEHRTFAGTYNRAIPQERPRYGALNFLAAREGGAAVYGPAVLTLRPEVKERTTYHTRDSRFTNMEDAGGAGVMAGCLARRSDEDLQQLLKVANGQLSSGVYGRDNHPEAFTGSNYIEAHIHGEINLAQDLAGVSLHERYRGTPVGNDAETMAKQFGVEMIWYKDPAFEVDTDGFLIR